MGAALQGVQELPLVLGWQRDTLLVTTDSVNVLLLDTRG